MTEMSKDLNLVREEIESKIDNKVVSIYLTGSRLYGINTEDSDTDLVAYVSPTRYDLVEGNFLSKEISISLDKIDKVKVQDIRLIRKDLMKPNLNSIHLLHQPLLGVAPIGPSYLAKAFNMSSKNLYLSMLAYCKKALESEEVKDMTRGLYFYTLYTEFTQRGISPSVFVASTLNYKVNLLKQIRCPSDGLVQEYLLKWVKTTQQEVEEAWEFELQRVSSKDSAAWGSLYLNFIDYITEILQENVFNE